MSACVVFLLTSILDCKSGPCIKTELLDFLEENGSKLKPSHVLDISLLCLIKISSRVIDPLFMCSNEDVAKSSSIKAIINLSLRSSFSTFHVLYSMRNVSNSFITFSHCATASSFSLPVPMRFSDEITRWDSNWLTLA